MPPNSKASPSYSQAPSKIYPGGRHTGGTSHHVASNEVGVDLNQIMGLVRKTGLPEPLESNQGALNVADSGFCAEVINFIYYVRVVDYNLFDGPNRIYVDDSQGRHKKFVTFKETDGPEDFAQVVILYYQVAAFPTRITRIHTFLDQVKHYLLNGDGDPFYDQNSAAQQSIEPNP